MARRLSTIAACMLLLLPGCGPSTAGPDGGAGDGPPPADDADGDGISDADEGRAAATDTDGDGTPDYQDTDSDGDGIVDAIEAGDDSLLTPPFDSDSDGNADFRDEDSDDNGRPDAVDGTGDLDDDGHRDFADADDDGDGMDDRIEIGPSADQPRDTDGDTLPDFRDVDSDNDTILDRHDLQMDPDGDGVPSYRDTDSDGDCRADSVEAGDLDLTTAPVDSDDDGGPDFVDLDSDNDGLLDGLEDVNCNGLRDPGESSPAAEDTDGDGVTDLIEVAAHTDATDPADNPLVRGDFVFLVPYQQPADPPEDRLDFSTAFQNVDVYFLIDTSGSMADEISSIHANIAGVIEAITCSPGEDPTLTNCIPDLETGVGIYGDQPPTDPIMIHLKDINGVNLVSDGAGSTQASLPTSAPGWGNEWHLQAMRMVIEGTCASDPARTGRGCYRSDALRLLVLATDEQFSQDPVWPSSSQPYEDALVDADIQMIGVWSNSSNLGSLTADMASLHGGAAPRDVVPTLVTTDVDTAACLSLPADAFYLSSRAIVFGDGATSSAAITCAIQAVTMYIAQDVRAVAVDDPTDAVDAPSAFIDYVETFMDGTAACPSYPSVTDGNGDGHPDIFQAILPGSPVCWKVHVKQNTSVPPTLEPQMFRATIQVYGTGMSLLDERDVYFLVPPDIPDPPIP